MVKDLGVEECYETISDRHAERCLLQRRVSRQRGTVMANLPGTAWLDEDGRHVWWEHQCSPEKGTVRYMLPWPHWQAVNGSVSPSIVCEVPGCGHHSIPLVQEPPTDWEPRKERPDMPANVQGDRLCAGTGK